MNDDQKLTETFDFNSSEPKKVLQKAKVYTLVRTVAVSLLVFLLLGAVVMIANAMLLNRIADKELIGEYLFDLVARPNTYMTHNQVNDGFLVGEAEYVAFRLVGNRPVYNGTYKIKYQIIPIVQDIYGTGRGQLIQIENENVANEFAFYNKVGHREMKFYHPYIEYETCPNDLALLEEIGEDKYIEMALSFDRDYSLEEVQAMLPDEMKLVWYWVDTYSEKYLDTMKGQYVEVEFKEEDGQPTSKKVYQKPRVLFANEAYGMKAITSTGEISPEPRRFFIAAINMGLKSKSRYQPVFKNLYDALRNDQGEITEDDIKVIGAVVTGDTASMELLKNKNYIKASTLGIVIDKF